MIAVKQKIAVKRVACYVRKSVADGGAQEFSSLHAQRESVANFVLSQRAGGWTLLDEQYEDDGYSGATTDRPGFKRLLEAVEAKSLDIIAVYRSDRLSRNLADFTRLMQFFECHDVTFVSVTEQFNTTTSMGRFTLNMLMSFAEFERETIADRVRDKIRASRERGYWTGGHWPLGFNIVDRKLVVNEAEADRVRQIFALYRTLGSLVTVAQELNARGWRTKSWKKKNGVVEPGRPFNKASVYSLLRCPLYAGLIRSGDDLVRGQHDAILDEDVWEETQRLLSTKQTTPRGWRPPTKNGAVLRGLLSCKCGASMLHHASHRGPKRWSYYVCSAALKRGAAACPGSRVPAGKLEAFVVDRIRQVGRDPRVLQATLTADLEQRDARRPELDAEVRRLSSERKRLEGEGRNVVKAIGRGTEGLDDRLAEIDAGLAQAVEAVKVARRDLRALDAGAIDAHELRRALADFEPVWSELSTAERSRVLGLLLQRITFDAESGDVEIKFRAGGPQALAAVKEPR